MKNMNKVRMKRDFSKMMISENSEMPIYVCDEMKRDFKHVLEKYADFSENNFRFSIKILSNSRYVFSLECLVDNISVKNNILH